MKKEEELKKQLWDLYSLTDGELGEKPPEKEMKKWRLKRKNGRKRNRRGFRNEL